MREICDDLRAEHRDLDSIVAGLEEAEWSIETPSPGWAIRDQISHLWFFDQRALMALTDPDAFVEDARVGEGDGTVARHAIHQRLESLVGRGNLRRRVLQCHPQLRRQGNRARCVVNFTNGPVSPC